MNIDAQINQSIKPLSTTQKVNLLHFIQEIRHEQQRSVELSRRQAMSQIQVALRRGFAF